MTVSKRPHPRIDATEFATQRVIAEPVCYENHCIRTKMVAIRLCDGIGRKVSVPILAIFVIGWILYFIAFRWLEANYIHDLEDHDNVGSFSLNFAGLATATGVTNYDSSDFVRDIGELNAAIELYTNYRVNYFCFAVVGPLMIIAMSIHLVVGHLVTGIFANFGVALYITAGGGILFLDGVQIYLYNRILDGIDSDDSLGSFKFGRYIILEFSGCLISVFFVAIHMCYWSAFTDPWPKGCCTCSNQDANNHGDSVTHTTYSAPTAYPAPTPYQPAGQFMGQPIHMVPVATYPPPGAFVMQQAVPQTTDTTVTTVNNETQ